MKVKKERKSKTKAPIKQKERKIGRIFNPIVHVLQVALTILFGYYVIFGSVAYVIPGICDLLYSMVNMAAVDNIPALLAVWAFPCLFAIAFLFLGDVILIRFVSRKIKGYADKLIVDYKTKQEKVAADMKSEAESDKD